MDKKKKTMQFRTCLYTDIYYDEYLSLMRQVTNETMDIPERERERYIQVVVGKIWTNTNLKVLIKTFQKL